LVAGVVTPERVEIQTSTLGTTVDDIAQFVGERCSEGMIVAIDAPTIVPHAYRMRDCERALQSDAEFRNAHAAPYPGTRSLLGKYNGGQPRGEELSRRLRAGLGFREVGCPPPRHSGRFVIEVFPAAAMVRLFGLVKPLAYKKKRGRSWDQCRAGLNEYISRLRGLQGPELVFPTDLPITGCRGKAFKDIEDRVDAVLCAYVAALAWLGRTEMIGSVEAGYIALPLRLVTSPAASHQRARSS
jgi:predicted RNase H-like nuclease